MDEKPLDSGYPDDPLQTTSGYDLGMEKQPATPNSKPLIAGILLMLAGLFGLLTWASVFMVTDFSIIDPSMLPPEITLEQIQQILQTCSIIGIVLSLLPILGGILSIQRKLWGIAVLGAVLGLLTVGPVFISSILSLIGLILLVMAKDAFR
jgi:hypothetical protein